MKRLIVLASAALLLVLLAAAWIQFRGPTPLALTPTLTGQVEYCLTCHRDLPEISQPHPVQTFGCVRCHGGERLALDADLAHSSMRGGANPADLSVVEASCGGNDCHSGDPADATRSHPAREDQHPGHLRRGHCPDPLYLWRPAGPGPPATASRPSRLTTDDRPTSPSQACWRLTPDQEDLTRR